VKSESSPIKVLVVDDSALVRQVISAILSGEGFLVTVAADPLIAMNKMARERPDVILLDLELPRMHGLTFLHNLMKEDPIPVVVCSTAAADGSAMAISALEEGAVAVIPKPKLGIRDFLHESAVTLIEAVRGAAHAKVGNRPRSRPPEPRQTAEAVLPKRPFQPSGDSNGRIVAIGASTGGPETIGAILERLCPDCAGIVIVQHMPEAFTGAFARRLDTLCAIEVREAASGDRIVPGCALIAPGNRHLTVGVSGGAFVAHVIDGTLVNRHRPSVDVLFRSVAQCAGPDALGILLTGMGDDGAAGLLEMKQAGASTVAQDEDSSIVFGMPKAAIALGAAESGETPWEIADKIAAWSSRVTMHKRNPNFGSL
jgi:two-component system chemotaxis response regulator CheB